MKLPKDLISVPGLEKFLKWEYWPYYLAVLAVLVLLGVAILFVLRRRRKTGSDEQPADEAAPQPLPRSSLRKIWKEFVGQIPPRLRRSIMIYRPFVVMGDLGSGKSTLIDSYTDWRGQARQFYPSHTADPRLQNYIGSKVLVQEIPGALLNNTSKDAHEALIKLWKPIFRRREPTVILALNWQSLATGARENFRRQAQMMRGKINVLAKVCGRPVKVCLALTLMDQLEGFVEFAEFVQQSRLPPYIELGAANGAGRLADALVPYEAQLSRALTTLPALKYLKVLTFFKDVQKVFAPLAAFVKILQQHDPLSPAPHFERLCLCHPDGGAAGFSNPFEYVLTAREVRTHNPLLKHRRAALAIAAAGLAYLVWGLAYEWHLFNRIDDTIDRMEAAPPAAYTEELHQMFPNFGATLTQTPALTFLPNFFPRWDQDIRERLVTYIRKFFLQPKFEKLASNDEDREKMVYLLALIYATRDNDLGKLVLSRRADWVAHLGLPHDLITDYVTNRLQPDNHYLILPTGSKTRLRPDASESPLPWRVFFTKVGIAGKQQVITPAYLRDLQDRADFFLKVTERAMRYQLTGRIVDLLDKLTPVGGQITWIRQHDHSWSQGDLKRFLEFIATGDVTHESTDGMDLVEFIENLKVMTKQKVSDPGDDFHFTFKGEDYDFKAEDWSNLLNRSRITLFIRDYTQKQRGADDIIFFGKDSGFPDVVMNPTNNGQLFFVGKGRVDGRLTRDAFEQRVKPVLAEIPDLLKSLPVSDEEKGRLSSFILKQSMAYADRYVAAYRDYYSTFHIQARNLGELRFGVEQILSPTSPFQEFLVTVRDNTDLDLGKSVYLSRFAEKLNTFAFIKRLMLEKDNAFPELDKYRAILQQMMAEVEGSQTYAASDSQDEAAELKSVLSPLGRISVDIFRNDGNSYESLTKAWLKNAGLETEWRKPFLEPVQMAFLIGRADVEPAIDKIWSHLRNYYITPMRKKFPFDDRNEVVITPEDVAAVALPQGAFWKSFKAYLAPLCQEVAGHWTERSSSPGVFGSRQTFRLPANMLSQVNALSKLSGLLYDEKGAPKPLQIAVKPSPLPPQRKKGPAVVLSYLHCGQASVFAFNQQPVWQQLDIQWWKRLSSAVGIQSETVQDTLKTFKEVSVPEGHWSFFRLLQKAGRSDENIFSWQMDMPGEKSAPVNIEFAVRSNPWTAFRVLE